MNAELAALLTPKGGDVPAHLVGVPRCLHKYEPLFRQPEANETDAKPSSVARTHAA
jgi:hypothetical protein